jgi:hypothetical protein
VFNLSTFLFPTSTNFSSLPIGPNPFLSFLQARAVCGGPPPGGADGQLLQQRHAQFAGDRVVAAVAGAREAALETAQVMAVPLDEAIARLEKRFPG